MCCAPSWSTVVWSPKIHIKQESPRQVTAMTTYNLCKKEKNTHTHEEKEAQNETLNPWTLIIGGFLFKPMLRVVVVTLHAISRPLTPVVSPNKSLKLPTTLEEITKHEVNRRTYPGVQGLWCWLPSVFGSSCNLPLSPHCLRWLRNRKTKTGANQLLDA